MSRSLEELAQIQQDHEERMEAERIRKEAEEKAERERRERAMEKLNLLHNKSKELQAAEKELDAFEESNIKERINESEEIKGVVKEKEDELINFKNDNDEVTQRIDGIIRLTEGKKYIAPEIEQELDEAKKADEIVKKKIEDLESIIEKLIEKIVSEKEIQDYEQSLDKVYMLKSEIKDIEDDPDVKEFLAEEIKQKNDMIELVMNTSLKRAEISAKEDISSAENEELSTARKEFVQKVTEQFLKDEIDSRQIDIIKDRDKRLDAYKKVSKYIITGLTNNDLKNVKFNNETSKIEKSLAYAGVSLANLIGICSSKGGIINIMGHEISEEEKSSKIEKTHKEYAINIHYKTLNILSAYTNEIGKSHFGNLVLGHAINFDSKKIKDEFKEIVIEENGLILPKKISQAEKAEAKKLFDIHGSIAIEIKDKMNSVLQRKKLEESDKLNAEIITLKNYLENMQEMDKELKNYNLKDIDNEENKINEILSNKITRLDTARKEFENTLLLNISKRNDLNKEIKDLEDFIENLKKNLEEVSFKKDNWKKTKENLESLKKDIGSSEEIKEKINKIEESLKKFKNI